MNSHWKNRPLIILNMSSRTPLANRSNRQPPSPSPARVVKKSRTVAVDEKRASVTLRVAVAHLIDGNTDKAVKLGKELLEQTGMTTSLTKPSIYWPSITAWMSSTFGFGGPTRNASNF